MTTRNDDTGSYTHAFNKENRLIEVNDGSGTTVFTYDANGQRMKTVRPDGTTVYTPFPQYEKEVLGADTTIRSNYMLGGRTIAVRVVESGSQTSDEVSYIHADHLGSNTVMTDDTGSTIAGSDARYYPFGGYRDAPSTDLTDKGFTGHQENRDIGLTYMRARYYIPSIGRFASADTIVPNPANPQNYNRFSYADNNPVIFVDPDGHCAVDANGEILTDSNGNLAKTDCTVDDFQALSWDQRLAWLEIFVAQFELANWFVDIEHAINVLANDADYSAMSGWAAYADAGVLQAINNGMRHWQGENIVGSGAAAWNAAVAWAGFFEVNQLWKANGSPEGLFERVVIAQRLAAEQSGVDYATTLPEAVQRKANSSPRVHDKIMLLLWGANSYRSLGIRCQISCPEIGQMTQQLIVAHTDPRTSGTKPLIGALSYAPSIVAGGWNTARNLGRLAVMY